MATLSFTALGLGLALAAVRVAALDNGLALTPPMGWSSRAQHGCAVTEDAVLDAARALVDTGLKDLGYEYVLVDDCWQADGRDSKSGAPAAHPTRFPSGIKALADQVHGMGLKLGLTSSAGTYTCAGKFGSLDHEKTDAEAFASWGVDYLKYENCDNEGQTGEPIRSYDRYSKMSLALRAVKRPILYSMANWGEDGPWNYAVNIANTWRIAGDIADNYNQFDWRCPCTSMLNCKFPGSHCPTTSVLDWVAGVLQKSGRGHWAALDMLQVGNGRMTYDEYVSHFSMWALVKSPLILNTKIADMSEETRAILTNDAIIDASQDAGSGPASRMWKKPIDGGELQLWSGQLSKKLFFPRHVFAVMNTSPHNVSANVSLLDVFADNGKQYGRRTFALYDLWQKDKYGRWGASLGEASGTIIADVPAHGVRVYRATPVPGWWRVLSSFLYFAPLPAVVALCAVFARRSRHMRGWVLRRIGYKLVSEHGRDLSE